MASVIWSVMKHHYDLSRFDLMKRVKMDEIETERNSITSYDVALRMSNDLLLF